MDTYIETNKQNRRVTFQLQFDGLKKWPKNIFAYIQRKKITHYARYRTGWGGGFDSSFFFISSFKDFFISFIYRFILFSNWPTQPLWGRPSRYGDGCCCWLSFLSLEQRHYFFFLNDFIIRFSFSNPQFFPFRISAFSYYF